MPCLPVFSKNRLQLIRSIVLLLTKQSALSRARLLGGSCAFMSVVCSDRFYSHCCGPALILTSACDDSLRRNRSTRSIVRLVDALMCVFASQLMLAATKIAQKSGVNFHPSFLWRPTVGVPPTQKQLRKPGERIVHFIKNCKNCYLLSQNFIFFGR